MTTRLIAAGTALVLAATAVSLRAHHSVAGSYDVSTLVPMSGIITRIEWRNPHVLIHITMRNNAGETLAGRIEIAAPGGLERRGVAQGHFKVGDQVNFQVWLPKAGPQFKGMAPSGRTVTVPDGRQFDVGDNWGVVK
jgi:hypothetical protein